MTTQATLPLVLNWIGGESRPAQSGEWLDGYEPATGKVYSRVASSDARDVEAAVAGAKAAQREWGARPAEERAAVLRRISELILERLEPLARAEAIDNGKPLRTARELDIPRSARNFAFFADAITQFSSEAYASSPTVHNVTLRSPLGVVGCISPWNLPLYLFTWKIAPALAAGNAVVAKPSEVTPMTASLLGELTREAGLPAGVLNIVQGLGPKVGAAMSVHPGIRALSFTGSTHTGAEISRVAAPLLKKLSLELGGKNPFLVFAEADFERALDGAVRASFSNQGQICLCGSRLYIERPLYERFREAFVARVRALRVGDPLEDSTDQGALVSREHLAKVLAAIDTAKREGARVLTGGGPARVGGRCEGGYFVEPTVLEGLPLSCRTNQEEIFGPVVTLAPFSGEREAVALANGTSYGLAASLWTGDLERAHRVAAALEFGIVWVNTWMRRDLRTPFGGMKDSGVGREGGLEALRFFTEPKNVCVELSTAELTS